MGADHRVCADDEVPVTPGRYRELLKITLWCYCAKCRPVCTFYIQISTLVWLPVQSSEDSDAPQHHLTLPFLFIICAEPPCSRQWFHKLILHYNKKSLKGYEKLSFTRLGGCHRWGLYSPGPHSHVNVTFVVNQVCCRSLSLILAVLRCTIVPVVVCMLLDNVCPWQVASVGTDAPLFRLPD